MSSIDLTPRAMSRIVITLAFAFILWAGFAGGWLFFLLASLVVISGAALSPMLSRPHSFVALMLGWYLFAFLSTNTYFPAFYQRYSFVFRYVDELLFFPLILGLLAQMALRHFWAGKPVILAAIAAVAITIISGLINDSSLRGMGLYIVSYYAYVLIFIGVATFYHPDKDQIRRLIHIAVAILLCQLLLNVFFVAGIEILPNRFIGQWDDAAVGTMGLSSTMSYYAIAILGVAAAWLGVGYQKRGRLYWWMVLGVCALLIAVAHAKHAVVPVAGQIGVIALVTTRGNVMRKLLLVLLAVGVLFGLIEVYNQAYQQIGQSLYDPELLTTVAGEQWEVYQNVARTLTRENRWLIGMGPGRYSSVVAMWDRTQLFMEHFYAEIFASRYNPRSSIMLYPRTGLLSLLGDTGVLGVLAYASILGVIALRVLRRVRAGAYAYSAEGRALAIGWLGWIVFYGLLHTIIDYLHFGLLPVLTFAWGGVVWNWSANNTGEEA